MGDRRATLTLLLIFCVILVAFPNVDIVTAEEETIYIRADGTVEGTDKILRDGNVYTFTDNIDGSITVSKPNIVIDGAGYALRGNGDDTGIRLAYLSGVMVKNLQITNFSVGVGLYLSGNNTFSENLLIQTDTAISLVDSINNTITENTIMNNTNGVCISQSSNNSFYGNSFVNNTKQVHDFAWNNPETPTSINTWFSSNTGNYWSDYNGKDSNGDGIGETPYIIDENNQDNHPLMTPNIIPEFPSWTPLLIALVAMVVVAVVYRKRLAK
ncbi:MAG: hypothetical protein NUK65_10640 [Firmicutes bacterium]|nr:hypothetical protein [Bacillota bacterium]